MGKKDSTKLTTKQMRYCQLRAEGKSQRQAYKGAGYSDRQKETTIDANSCNLEKIEKIRDKIRELQEKADRGCILTTEQRKQALTDIYLDTNKADKDRLKALDLLNRMSGDYIDKKEINATVQGLTRSDRLDAMQDTLETLKKAWSDSDIEK